MIRLRFIFLAGVLSAALAWGDIEPKSPSKLDGAFVITEQSPTLDWWVRVPANTGAHVTNVQRVYRGQRVSLIPFVKGYSLSGQDRFDLSYSLFKKIGEQTQPILTDYRISGTSHDPDMLQVPAQFVGLTFADNDPVGTYSFTVEFRDLLTGQTFQKEQQVELAEWVQPEEDRFTPEQLQLGHIMYCMNPDPDWLWLSFLSDEVSFEQSGSAWGYNFVLLSFYKYAFDKYMFLVPKLDAHFKEASAVQRLKIILLYALLGQPEIDAGRLSVDEAAYQSQVREIKFPEPYAKLSAPSDIDWLWGEFFATGLYAPLKRMCEGFELLPYAKAPERVLRESKDTKEPVSDEHVDEFWKGKAFAGLLQSVIGNAARSQLAKQYLAYILENEKLSKNSQALLTAVMRKIWPERYPGASVNPANISTPVAAPNVIVPSMP